MISILFAKSKMDKSQYQLVPKLNVFQFLICNFYFSSIAIALTTAVGRGPGIQPGGRHG